ncbi:uncharacterized protein LOC124170313 [Ischnura elegans]|uniref:uncharacterized protein LOC124170313 n=1 Tax=Ischnura elegans TaxID=197161 RepID=UPI001ED8A04A|nr:uncharacterized protein LOC124170313 [Ischnura elegans]XP_046404979.1 uncharacterized protein LOC124170313 [Ischnura elegans]XP_046404980.1 uncharacterized protein LOC124170313 [Ischnura elegans]
MTSNISAVNSEAFVKERLFAGLSTGSLLQHKDLMDMLKDVDIRGMWQRTPLHEGVRLGKADWVEELLSRGADPLLMDDSRESPLSAAQEMVRLFPKDPHRLQVLKLVTLVHRRDEAMVQRRIVSPSAPTASLLHGTSSEVSRSDSEIASLKTCVDPLRQEMKSPVAQVGPSVSEGKDQTRGHYPLLQSHEAAEPWTGESATVAAAGLGTIVLSSVAIEERHKCIEGMLGKTRMVQGDRFDRVRWFYERIYDRDDFTALMLKHLSVEAGVKVLVDSESTNIGRMKQKCYDVTGLMEKGKRLTVFADVESGTVYFGAGEGFSDDLVAGWFARALSLLSQMLLFGNKGRPYERGDSESEHEWKKVMDEVVEEKSWRAFILDRWILYAYSKMSDLAKDCYMAATVPGIIARSGSAAGRYQLLDSVPLLFAFYSNHVVPKMLAKTRSNDVA